MAGFYHSEMDGFMESFNKTAKSSCNRAAMIEINGLIVCIQELVQTVIKYFSLWNAVWQETRVFWSWKACSGEPLPKLLIYTHNLFASKLKHWQEFSGLLGPPVVYIHQGWLDGSPTSSGLWRCVFGTLSSTKCGVICGFLFLFISVSVFSVYNLSPAEWLGQRHVYTTVFEICC